VIVEAVVSLGVTPLDTAMFGVTVPLYKSTPAPDSAVPIPK
jgi:hypothetical protein